MMPSSEETLEASFSPVVALSYAKAGRGTGTVTFSAEGSVGTCDAACNQTFDLGTVVTLTATAGPQARFVNWTGSCRGRSTCIITMSQAKAVRAYFIGR